MSYLSKKAAAKDGAKVVGWLITGAGFIIAIPITLLVMLIMWGVKRAKSKRAHEKTRK